MAAMSYNPLLEKSHGDEDDNVNERTSFDSDHGTPLCHSCQRQGRIRRRLSPFSTILVPLTLVIIAGLLAFNLSQTLLVKTTVKSEHEVVHGVYGHDRDYMSLDHKFDHLWAADASGEGAVMLPLSPGEPETIGLIGMFHALHCLAGFRHALQRAKAGEDIGMDDNDDGHWPHCFYHMRRAIHCAADDTIERQRFRNGSIGSQFINGQWDVRRCGNSDKLYALKAKHGA